MAKNIADAGGVVVLGLGRFGKSLALELERDGVEVLGVERDAKRVQDLAGRLTHVVQATISCFSHFIPKFAKTWPINLPA